MRGIHLVPVMLALRAAAAQAQSARNFVSGLGNDSNVPSPRPAGLCRTPIRSRLDGEINVAAEAQVTCRYQLENGYMKFRLAIWSAMIATALVIAPASAATFRTAVSISGVDTNPCTPAAPCRTIAYALTQTSPGGEMLVLSSGGYGPFTITQAITIASPPGTLTAVSAPSGNAITVNAGPTDVVLLSGLLLNGLGTGDNGIKVNSVGGLSVTRSNITGFAGYGISFTPVLGSGPATLTLLETSSYVNVTGALLVKPSGGTAGAAASRVSLNNSLFASSPVTIDSTGTVGNISSQLNESTIRYSSSLVVNAAGNGAYTQVAISRSFLFSTPAALFANGPGASINMSASSVSSVGTVATVTNGGVIHSYGNNEMEYVGSFGALGSASLH